MSDPFHYNPDDAYYGPLGEIAKRHRTEIEINLEAFYAMLLPAVGWLIGRRAVFLYQQDRHHPNLFAAVVGKTSCGKGTAWNIVQSLLEQVEPDCPKRLHRDVASAPGLIQLVRDASTRMERGKQVEDPGVADKRCFVLFEEMENLFTSTRRAGSTLEKVWNMAWDGRTLENNGRNREKATDPHICCVAHITPESFQQAIEKASGGLGATNGFLNRFITIRAMQERILPMGGNLPDVADCIDSIRQAIAWLGPVNQGSPKRIDWHPDTRSEWTAFVHAAHSDHPFLEGIRPVTARLKPMITRIAMLFAVIDRQDQIRPHHLLAAKAFCLQSIDLARPLFTQGTKGSGAKTLPNRILNAVREGNSTLSDISHRLGGKGFTGEQKRQALKDLLAQGLITQGTAITDKGNQVDGWFPVADSAHADAIQPSDPDSELRQSLGRGAEVVVMEDTEAVGLDGSSVRVAGGQTGFLAHFTEAATEDDRKFVDRITSDRPKHQPVIVGDTPLLIDWHVMRLASRVAVA